MFPPNLKQNSTTSASELSGAKSLRHSSSADSGRFACFYPNRKFYPACISEIGQALYSAPATITEESKFGRQRLQLNTIRSHESFSTLSCEMMRVADYQLKNGEFVQSYELEAKKEYNANIGKYSHSLHVIQVSLKEAKEARNQICDETMEVQSNVFVSDDVQEAHIELN